MSNIKVTRVDGTVEIIEAVSIVFEDGTIMGGSDGAGLTKPGNTQGSQVVAANELDQALIEIATIDTENAERIFVEIAIVGQDLDQFVISGRAHASGDYQVLYSTSADYISPLDGILQGTSGDLTIIAPATSGWFIMDVLGLESVLIEAACDADNGSSTVYWSAN